MAEEDGLQKDNVKCEDCHGTGNVGNVEQWQPCKNCKGTGYLTRVSYTYQKEPLFGEGKTGAEDFWDSIEPEDNQAMEEDPLSLMRDTTYVVNCTEMPHSLGGRLAGPGTEWKLYGKTVQHLVDQVKELAEHPDLPLALQQLKTRYAETKEQK